MRVEFAKSAILFTNRAKAALPQTAAVKWTLTETSGALTLATARLKARVERQTGRVSFTDAAGQPILAEAAGGHVLESAEVQGEQTYHARQSWQANADESLYGLGQQQIGAGGYQRLRHGHVAAQHARRGAHVGFEPRLRDLLG